MKTVETTVVSTPEPAVITAVPTATPVVEFSQPEVMLMPEGNNVPDTYTSVSNEELADSTTVFTFINSAGEQVYRVYAAYNELTNGKVTDTIGGFYASDENGALLGSEAIDPENDDFGQCTAMELPETLRIRKLYTATGSTGHFQSADPEHPGFVVYGSFQQDDSGDGAFYPANADGTMIAGALPVSYSVAVPAYTPQDDPNAADGQRKLVVYIGSQSVVCYRAKNGEWTVERLMICSTGRKDDATPRGDFAIMKQYLYKKMGKVQGENVYSQYASRITGSYLFHSVPIGGEDRYKQANGKKQMYTKYYEQLGTVASGGCVRLLCKDAYWIYMNCEVGTPVTITDDVGPDAPEIPAQIYEQPYMDKRGDFGWDPTDPDPENPYHAIYEPEFVTDGNVIDKSKVDTTAAGATPEPADDNVAVE